MSDLSRRLGIVVGGSLSEGLTARIDPEVSLEELAVGRYVVVEGQRRRFFGMITDIELGVTHPQLAITPPDVSDPFVAEVLAGTCAFGLLKVMPMLTMEFGDGILGQPQPVKTVPPHFARASEATEADVAAVFGAEDADHYVIGTPLDMDVPVCLDLSRLVARSSGVFGKSGTGKTFLTRLVLAGIVQKDAAVNLVFDMHNEYGWEGKGERGNVKGLKQLFSSRVAIFTLDPVSSKSRGVSPDHVVEIGYDQIEPGDVEILREALDMTQAQIESVHKLARIYGDDRWLATFLDLDAEGREAVATQLGLSGSTLNVLHRKMETRLGRLPFLKPKVQDNSVQRLLEYLRKGTSVVLEFGRLGSLDAYMLVANVLTRRIHQQYVDETERAMGNRSAEPRPLVITIEEAHKFLSPEVADQTIFGTIARELRKYHVTLLVVDQRPSGIADEVMSQIGTRITCLLDDERDTSAVLSGVSGAKSLREVLARLDTMQQALILGHAVPMPVVIRTRDYGTPESYAKFGFREGIELARQVARDIEDLFPE